MTAHSAIKILVVDDLPEKLLVYQSVLEGLDVELILARSGPEALRHVLSHDFAVILLDVNMPGMDGYETAATIRSRKRSAHTPIIFVTAHADELHALKGYAYGAVDYILSPVVPDVLRTKVRAFTDLHRLNQQARDHAARELALAARERAQLSAVLDRANDLVGRVDTDGRLTHINAAGLRMLGAAEHTPPSSLPALSMIIGSDMLRAAIATAQADGACFGETTLSTCDGRQIPASQLLLAHKDETGRVESFSLIAQDISDRKRADEARARLAAIVESSDDAMISKTLEGIVTSWNGGAERLFGYRAAEMLGKPIMLLIPAERHAEESMILDKIRAGIHIEHFETIRVAKDGRHIDISLTISPISDTRGRIIGASKVARDITDRRRAEAELAKHREQLEDLVRERTEQLEASHERLRLADRLASIGTLTAGLGHDMGNLLLPVRVRLASLERAAIPDDAREHIAAIRTACEYMQRLSQGLRLFALDPDQSRPGESTRVSTWWPEVEAFLRNALPKGVTLKHQFADDLPPMAIAPHALTQVVYNLVQNAGDAMRDRASGHVIITAQAASGGATVQIAVADNGPGMTDEVRARCMEPFFTTRTRRISTGLGLALVHGLISRANGSVELQSQPGRGTTFVLTLPRAAPVVEPSPPRRQATVCVSLSDARLSAYLAAVLRQVGAPICPAWSAQSPADVIVLDAVNGSRNELERFLRADPHRQALVIAGAPPEQPHERVVWLDEDDRSPAAIRSSLLCMLKSMPHAGEPPAAARQAIPNDGACVERSVA